MIRVSSFGQEALPLRDRYIERLKKMIPFEWREIRIRNMPSQRTPQLLPEEKKFLEESSNFVLLDVSGKELDSDEFHKLCFRNSELHFVLGPAIGFHQDFFEKAQSKISLSKLTMTHQLAQIVLAEAVYRSACIEKNHPFVK
jgi:23S rRNA (pseudouridine1915-N3)-methyltransferase